MAYIKPSSFHYELAKGLSFLAAKLVFRRKVLRNEIKNVKGPFVVIANHEAALDFVNLIGLSKRRMSFVISNSFYSTLPVKKIMDRMGVIPKQQFQTSAKDLKRIKSVIAAGEPVAIYPAGLMCEDGLSTPIPAATYKFLRWLGVDVYMARCTGTYFVMPKWAGGIRPGRTLMDVYKLFDKDELPLLSDDEIRSRTDEALLFDAYREQEVLKAGYMKIKDLRGLENVLARCPNCGREFTVEVKGKSSLCCTACGFTQEGDAYGILHKTSEAGEEIKYISDWSRMNFEAQKAKLISGEESSLSSRVQVKMIDPNKNKFVPVGEAELCLTADKFTIEGTINGEEKHIEISTLNIPTLPFSPGKHLEVQDGQTIYRCLPENGRLVMKYINMLKAFYEIHQN